MKYINNFMVIQINLSLEKKNYPLINCYSNYKKALTKDEIDSDIDALIQQRSFARKNKDWIKADKIRNQLDELGVILEDTSDGTIWKRK